MSTTASSRWLAVVTAWCLTSWWAESRLLLSDDGLYATAGFAEAVRYPGRWSVFDPLSAPSAVRMVLVLAGALCVLWFVKPTKVTGTGCLVALFVCVASLNARAPFAISSADMYLAVLLFWATVGGILGHGPRFVRIVRVQVALIYAMPLSIRFAFGGDSWIDGSALHRIVGNRGVARGPLGSLAAHFPGVVLSAATWAALVIEIAIVCTLVGLAIVPNRVSDSVRTRVLVSGIALHLAIGLVCGLWFFSAVAIVGLLVGLCRQPEQDSTSSVRWLVPLAVLACVVCWNLLSLSSTPAVAAGRQRNVASLVVRGLGITQVWGVFSPNPPRTQRWVDIVDQRGDVIVSTRHAGDRMRKLAQNAASQPDGPLSLAWLAATGEQGAAMLVVRP